MALYQTIPEWNTSSNAILSKWTLGRTSLAYQTENLLTPVMREPAFEKLWEGLENQCFITLISTMLTHDDELETDELVITVPTSATRDIPTRFAACMRGTQATSAVRFRVNKKEFGMMYNSAAAIKGECKTNMSTGMKQVSSRALEVIGTRAFTDERVAKKPHYAFNVKYAWLAALAVVTRKFELIGNSLHQPAGDYVALNPMPLQVVAASSGPIGRANHKVFRSGSCKEIDLAEVKPYSEKKPDKATAIQRAPRRPGEKGVCHQTDLESSLSAYTRINAKDRPPVPTGTDADKIRAIYYRMSESLMRTMDSFGESFPSFPQKYSEQEVYDCLSKIDGTYGYDFRKKIAWTLQVKKQEVTSKSKHARAILSLPQLFDFFRGAYCMSMFEQLVIHHYRDFVKKGLNERQVRGLMGQLLKKYKRFLSTDFSNFDSTVNALFQELEAHLLRMFAERVNCLHLMQPTLDDKMRKEIPFKNEFIFGQIKQSRKSGERLTSICNLLALIVNFCFTIEMCEGCDPVIADNITTSILNGKEYDSTNFQDGISAGDAEPPMKVGFAGEGDDCVRAFAGLRDQFKQLYDPDHHVRCALRCGMKLTISLTSEHVITFCSKFYARGEDSDLYGAKCIVDPARGLSRLAVQFNPPASFCTAYGSGKELMIDDECLCECAVLCLTSLIAYLEGGANHTPYISMLFYRAAEFWQGQIETIMESVDVEKVFFNVRRDGMVRKTLEADMYAKSFPELVSRLHNVYPDDSDCPLVLREIIAKELNVYVGDLEEITAHVPMVTLDHFENPEYFYISDMPYYQLVKVTQLHDFLGVTKEELDKKPEPIIDVERSVSMEIPSGSGDTLVRVSADSRQRTATTKSAAASPIARAAPNRPAPVLPLPPPQFNPPPLKMITREDCASSVTQLEFDIMQHQRVVNQERSKHYVAGKEIGSIMLVQHMTKKLKYLHTILQGTAERICKERLSSAGGKDKDIWKRIQECVGSNQRAPHSVVYDKFFDKSVTFQANDHWKALLGRQFGSLRVGVNGRATCIYLEHPDVPLNTWRDTSPHVTLYFFGSHMKAEGVMAEEYNDIDTELAKSMALMLCHELLAYLADKPDLTEQCESERKFYATIPADREYDNMLQKDNGFRCYPPAKARGAKWDQDECAAYARLQVQTWAAKSRDDTGRIIHHLTPMDQPRASPARVEAPAKGKGAKGGKSTAKGGKGAAKGGKDSTKGKGAKTGKAPQNGAKGGKDSGKGQRNPALNTTA
jgi:hypothetical protein